MKGKSEGDEKNCGLSAIGQKKFLKKDDIFMKQEKAIVNVFKLDEKVLRNVKAFEGRNIAPLEPAVIVVNAESENEHKLNILIEINGCEPRMEFDCPWEVIKDMPGFREPDGLEGFVKYMVSLNVLNWEILLEQFDRINGI